MKQTLLMLIALFVLSVNMVQAQETITDAEIENLLSNDEERPLTNAEMKALWKKMKKVDKEYRNSLTKGLTTNQVMQMKNWLKKEKPKKTIGNILMIASPLVLIGVPAIGRSMSNERYSNGEKATPEWSQTIAAIGGPTLFLGGAILWGRGNKRYNTSQLLIVDTPIQHEFHSKKLYASTGLKLLNDPYSNQFVLGTGVTISF